MGQSLNYYAPHAPMVRAVADHRMGKHAHSALAPQPMVEY